MTAVPSSSTNYLVISAGNIPFRGEEVSVNIKLHWPSYFKWDTNNYDEPVKLIIQQFKDWITQNKMHFDERISAKLEHVARYSAVYSLYQQPPSWRNELSNSESEGFKNLYTMMLATAAGYIWDDVLDRLYGTAELPVVSSALAKITHRIMEQEFPDFDALKQHLSSSDNPWLLEEKYIPPLVLQQYTAERFRDAHDIKLKDFVYVGIEVRKIYDYMTWYGGVGLENMQDLARREIIRPVLAGGYTWIEYYFALSGLQLHPKIREDKYWERLCVLAIRVGYLCNDFLSFKAEMLENYQDNIISFFAGKGESLPSAIQKSIEYYNDCIRELTQLLEYLADGEHPPPTDSDPVLAAKLELDYNFVIETLKGMVCSTWQAQLFCSRYDVSYSFESGQ